MIYLLTAPFADQFTLFNLFQYQTFRTGMALATALLVVFMIGRPMINWLRRKQGKGQPIRADGPESHLLTKKGTPTMGGFMILIGLGAGGLLWADLRNPYVWVVLFVTIGFGLIGFVDDFKKVTKQKHDGLSGRLRLFFEFSIAGVATIVIMGLHAGQTTAGAAAWGPAQVFADGLGAIAQSFTSARGTAPDGFETSVALPFFKDVLINLGPLALVFGMFVIVGAGNAVNLTDGLDGLAIGPVMLAALTFGAITYLAGNKLFSDYLQLHFTPGTGEIAVLLGALIGAGLGFLWYNAPPAMVFMGDTGSLALGGMLGAVAVASKHEIVLAIVGGLFVMEAVSVMIQVGYYRLTKKRIFLMAPIHHHFEKLGWKEPTIVIRFWIISVVLALIGLATLKLR